MRAIVGEGGREDRGIKSHQTKAQGLRGGKRQKSEKWRQQNETERNRNIPSYTYETAKAAGAVLR